MTTMATVSPDDHERCPACGGEVHRLAGRCRHCKADLAASRAQAARGPAAAPVPVAAVVPRRAPRLRGAPLVVTIAALAVTAGVLAFAAVRLSRRPATPAGPAARVQQPARSPAAAAPIPAPAPDPDPRRSTTPADADAFLADLGDRLCDKLATCGAGGPRIDPVCRLLADSLREPAGGLGGCRFDARAAASCLRAVDDLPCDPGAGLDPIVLFAVAESLDACVGALVCE